MQMANKDRVIEFSITVGTSREKAKRISNDIRVYIERLLYGYATPYYMDKYGVKEKDGK